MLIPARTNTPYSVPWNRPRNPTYRDTRRQDGTVLSKELEVTLNLAFKAAREQRHEFMTIEHLLLALIDNPTAAKVLRACGADLNQLRRQLTDFIRENSPALPEDEERDTQPTLGFQRVLQRAVFHVQSSGKKEVTGANVLVAIFGERESQAVYLLGQQNIARLDVVNCISHGISKLGEEENTGENTANAEEEGEAGEASKTALDQFCTNLNERAR